MMDHGKQQLGGDIPSRAPSAMSVSSVTSTSAIVRRRSNITAPSSDAAQIQKISEEFTYLMERSQSLFHGLRDLPQFGNKQWMPYFGRTFEVFTRLWKFQQQKRSELEVGPQKLERYQIGDIASKIGQLYYAYYLRTSETSFLNESYIFYNAIRHRQYFKVAPAPEAVNADEATTAEEPAVTISPEFIVKQLRYYARFIVTCLLLRRMDMARELCEELKELVASYAQAVPKPADLNDWQLVSDEIVVFLKAESTFRVVCNDSDNIATVINLRLPKEKNALAKASAGESDGKIRIQEALLVSNRKSQIKFSELTLDLYRVLQMLERDSSTSKTDSNSLRNPHKYLLFKPSWSQLMVFVATACRELKSQYSAFLLYLSADGVGREGAPTLGGQYDQGGLMTSSRTNETPLVGEPAFLRNTTTLYPADLVPFTRRPLLLIVDSTNSLAFRSLLPFFGAPVLVLMSPVQIPSKLRVSGKSGSLFTLFLSSPMEALCLITSTPEFLLKQYERCMEHLSKVLAIAERILLAHEDVDITIKRFMDDDFSRQILCRYLFCALVLRRHTQFQGNDEFQPQCSPELPPNLWEQIYSSGGMWELLKKNIIEPLKLIGLFKP